MSTNDCGCFACIGNEPAHEGSWLTVAGLAGLVAEEASNGR